jgi:hypothetical protein
MKLYTFLATISFSISSFAAVAPTEGVSGSKNQSVSLGAQLERGKIEPNENRSSFQTADINVYTAAYSYKMADDFYIPKLTLKIEGKSFTSGEEKVNGQLFYDKDSGSAVSVSGSAPIFEEPTSAMAAYFSITPYIQFNEDKFSVPRIDQFAGGLQSLQN